MKVIAFYTKNTPYEQEAEEFRTSFDQYKVDYHIYELETKGSWVANCAQKPRAIFKALKEFNDNILYLDIDARLVRQPPFEEIEKDIPGFCIWSRPWMRNSNDRELLSGTIYFPNNLISKNIVQDWMQMQAGSPTEWDQKTLQRVVDNMSYPYFTMDMNWVFIEKFMKPLAKDPIVLHTQASRRLKDRV